jgi:hypothetical protein
MTPPTTQGDPGLRGPAMAAQSGTIDVEIGPNEVSIDMGEVGAGERASFAVGSGRRLSVPVPQVPPGTLLAITVGRGLRAKVLLVEVVATAR